MGLLSWIPGADTVTNALGFQTPGNTGAGKRLTADADAFGNIADTAGKVTGYGTNANGNGPKKQAAIDKAERDRAAAQASGDPAALKAAFAESIASRDMPNDTGDMTAPTAARPEWQQAPVSQAQATNAAATTATPAQMAAAQMGGSQLNTAQSDQQREAQGALAGNLMNTASGQGPSVAQEQLRQSTAGNINQQMAAAQSAHGAARLAALRGATWNNAGIQQTANSQAAGLRAQEIATAQGQLGNVLGTARGQDVTTAGLNAQLGEQTGVTNAGYTQGANLANAGYVQGANTLNAQLGTNTSQFNAGNQTGVSQYNAGAQNVSSNNYANAQNAGNLSLSEADLNAQLNTNNLNTQRQQAYINDLLNAQQGRMSGDTTLYGGQAAYNSGMRQMTGQAVNAAGGAMGYTVPSGSPLGGGLDINSPSGLNDEDYLKLLQG